MFPTKKREWITGNFTVFTYTWKDWLDIRPYDYLWKSYRPLIWNIREAGESYEIQILFLEPTGHLDFVCALIRAAAEHESQIQKWMEERNLN